MRKTVALAVHLQNVDVMGETVEQCAGQAFRAKHRSPLVEWQVRGDDGGATFVALAERLEQQFGAGGRQWHVAQFINDEQLVCLDLALELEQTLRQLEGFQMMGQQNLRQSRLDWTRRYRS